MQHDIFNAPSFLWQRAAGAHGGRYRAPVPRKCDVVIVGAGGVGLSAARAFANQRKSVVILEMADVIGGISAHNGGIYLDGIEGDVIDLVKKYGETGLRDYLEISYQAIAVVRSLSGAVSRGSSSKCGYITAFYDEEQLVLHKKRLQLICRVYPEAYHLNQFTTLAPNDLTSVFFRHGIHSPHGGVLDSGRFIHDLAMQLRAKQNVTIATRKEVMGFEAALKHGTRVIYRCDSGLCDVEAARVILTGAAWQLLPNFPAPQDAATGMVATAPLPSYLLRPIQQSPFWQVPVQGPEEIGPDYYRFVQTEEGVRLLLGAGGRVGTNEQDFVLTDVIESMARNFPAIAKKIATDKLSVSHHWARQQIMTSNALPTVCAFDPAAHAYMVLPALENGANTRDIPHVPVLYIGGLGGHGIAFYHYLGLASAFNRLRHYRALQICNSYSADKPWEKAKAKKEVAEERVPVRLEEKKRRRRGITIAPDAAK